MVRPALAQADVAAAVRLAEALKLQPAQAERLASAVRSAHRRPAVAAGLLGLGAGSRDRPGGGRPLRRAALGGSAARGAGRPARRPQRTVPGREPRDGAGRRTGRGHHRPGRSGFDGTAARGRVRAGPAGRVPNHLVRPVARRQPPRRDRRRGAGRRRRGGGRRRTPARLRQRCAGGALSRRRAGARAGGTRLRPALRAEGGPLRGADARRRRPARPGADLAGLRRGRHRPGQGAGRPRRRLHPRAPGRAGDHVAARPSHGPAHLHHADRRGRVRGAAHPDPARGGLHPRQPRLRSAADGDVPDPAAPPLRPDPGHWANRQRQDHHALCRAAAAGDARPQGADDRGSDRIRVRRDQPDPGQRGGRRHLRLRPARLPAPRSRRDPGGRDPRRRDRPAGDPGGADRSPRAGDVARQRRGRRARPPRRPRRRALPARRRADRRLGPAPRPQTLRTLRRAAHARRRRRSKCSRRTACRGAC